MKRSILFLLGVIILLLNVGSVTLYPEEFNKINQVDFSLTNYDLSSSIQGIYELTVSIQNTGDLATGGSVPLSWEILHYELALSNGTGTLSESVADYDINGDSDTDDTFDIAWNNTVRPWDAVIDGVYVYALADHPENHWFNRTFYIDGNSKLFQLGNKMHTLIRADNETASFGFDAWITQHTSPNFELLVYSDVTFFELHIGGNPVEADLIYKGVGKRADDTVYNYTACVLPNQVSEIGANEEREYSITFMAHETITCDVFVVMNWSPDGITTYRWVPVYQQESFEAINRPFYEVVDSTVTTVDAGKKNLKATLKNIGTPATVGNVLIPWETLGYDLSLDNGVGILQESDVGIDLNGDSDTTDSFDVTWSPSSTRPWDATVDGNHVYSLNEESYSPPYIRNRTYYIDGNSKLFQLGSETHFLYRADNDIASFGFGDAGIISHPSPNFEFFLEYEGPELNILATDFEINGVPVEVNYSTAIKQYYTVGLFTDHLYVVPTQAFEIGTGEEVIFSCTLISQDIVTCAVALIMNWTPDGKIRYIHVPFVELDLSFEPQLTTTSATTTPTTTTTSATTTPTTTITPSWSALLLLLSLIAIFSWRQRKKKS